MQEDATYGFTLAFYKKEEECSEIRRVSMLEELLIVGLINS